MRIVLGLVEGSWVDIGIALAGAAIVALGTFIYLKIKSVKQDFMVDVDKKIDEKIEPIKSSMKDYEKDIKELKKDELEPIKKDINDIKREQDVMNSILGTLVKTLDRNHEESNRNHLEIKELMKDRDRSYKENFLLLFEKLDKKQDKK